MASVKMKLSANNLQNLPYGDIGWDTQVLGFGAKKLKNEHISMFLNYQDRTTGKYRRQTIARLGEMSVAQARDRAAQLKLEVRAGKNPIEDVETPKARAKHGDTLGQLVQRWLDSPKHGWSDATRKGYANAMARDLLGDEVAGIRIGEVKRADLMRLVDRATDRSPSSGALFFRTLNSFLSWADARGLTEVTLPKASRAAPASTARTRVMTDGEIAALWANATRLRPLTALCGRVMLLTAQRSGAVQQLHRDWIRQDGITWPASVMKGARDHWTPLTPWAFDQMRPLMDLTGHVFGKNTSRLSQAWPAWRPCDDLRMHDVRRSLKTWAAGQGINDLHSEAALAHAVQKDALAKAYQQHDYADEGGEVIRAWQNHVRGLVA